MGRPMAPLLHGRTAAGADASQEALLPPLPGFRIGIHEAGIGVSCGTQGIPPQPY